LRVAAVKGSVVAFVSFIALALTFDGQTHQEQDGTGRQASGRRT
jgi:hypothetical protein